MIHKSDGMEQSGRLKKSTVDASVQMEMIIVERNLARPQSRDRNEGAANEDE